MLPVKPTTVKADGNAEVVTMLEQWLERAKQGRLAFAVIVAAENPIHVMSDHRGTMQLAFAVNWGLDQAKHLLMINMNSRHEMPEQAELGSDRVCYNITKGPACYDFIAWLIIAEMNRRRAGAPAPLKIGFVMNDSDEEREKHRTLRQNFYDGVIMPSLALIGAVSDQDACNAPQLDRYTLRPIVEYARAGEQVPLLAPSADGLAAIGEFLRQTTGGQAPITITLREAPYTEYRNSDMTEWLKAAEYLEASGERVIFLRDTARAMEPITGFATCPAASIDLDTRMALYESAKCNMFVSNGPWYLALFGTRSWLMFVETNDMSPFHPETNQFYLQWHAVNPHLNEQFPWSKPTQRVVWKRDNAKNIIAAWEKLRPLLQEQTLEAAE